MLILIEKDSATRIPKECTPELAAEFAGSFPVYVVGEHGETTPFNEWQDGQGIGVPVEQLAELGAPSEAAPVDAAQN